MELEIRSLCDFIIKHIETGHFVTWGRMNGIYGSYGSWILTDEEHRGYPMTYQEAKACIDGLIKTEGGTYEIISRKKSHVTLTKA